MLQSQVSSFYTVLARQRIDVLLCERKATGEGSCVR